ncbi:MAG: GvpL/GvpF family gas vesicle protein [Planctomycetota bacterium]
MSQPVYIYAFCETDAEPRLPDGIAGAPVRVIECGPLTAAVSDVNAGRVRPQRRMLAAHQQVVSTLAESVPTLPAAFGLIADSVDELVGAVHDNVDALRAELDRVGNCIEFDVRLVWDAENVFEHLVSIDGVLASMRDELTSLGDGAPHELRVEVGRRVERVLASHRAAGSAAIVDAIAPVCREIDESEPSGEHELVRLAALVEREQRSAFEDAVAEAAEHFDTSYLLRLAGPFAPHTFVDLHLSLSNSRMAA